MATEFLHVRGYARRATGASPTIDGVLGEARRDPDHCLHLREPQPPIVRYGVAIEDVAAMLDERLREARDRLGRPLPVTSLALLAGVTSWPTPRLEVQASEAKRAAYETWVGLCTAFCQRLFDKALLSIVEHVDEERLHLHIFAAASPDPITHLYSLETIWPPLAAEARSRRAQEPRKLQRAAFSKQAREIQSTYYRTVGAPCGLSRYGPRRQRLTREAWRAQRDQATALAEFARDVARRAKAIDAEVRSRAETLASEAVAAEVARATAAAQANLARSEASCSRVTARSQSIEQRLRDERQETDRLRQLLVGLGVDPDGPSDLFQR